MKFRYGKSSKKRLNLAHSDLALILTVSLAMSDIDFGIAETYRPLKKQNQYYNQGKSKIDGIIRIGKHNVLPSLAADIYPFIEGSARWDNEHLSYIAGVITTVAKQLYNEGKIIHLIRWGGNWDMDGEILLDQSFDDRPHFELYKPK